MKGCSVRWNSNCWIALPFGGCIGATVSGNRSNANSKVESTKVRLRAKSRFKEPNEEFSDVDYEKQQRFGLWRFGLLAFGVIGSLCVLNWLYLHYGYVRYFKPAVVELSQRNYSAAERDFHSYLRIDDQPDGHYYLGQTLLAEGRLSEARSEFARDGFFYIARHSGGFWLPNSRSAEYLRHLPK